MYGGIARRNAMDSAVDSWMISPCPTLLSRLMARNIVNNVLATLVTFLFGQNRVRRQPCVGGGKSQAAKSQPTQHVQLICTSYSSCINIY